MIERDYKLSGQEHNNSFYVDDAMLASDKLEGMRDMLRSFEDADGAVRLRFNPAKCVILHMKGRGAARVWQTHFAVQEEVRRSLATGETYDHLGTPTRFQIIQTPIATIGELVEDLRVVDRSLLASRQELNVAAIFILPHMDFYLRQFYVQKGHLNDADKELKRLAKS